MPSKWWACFPSWVLFDLSNDSTDMLVGKTKSCPQGGKTEGQYCYLSETLASLIDNSVQCHLHEQPQLPDHFDLRLQLVFFTAHSFSFSQVGSHPCLLRLTTLNVIDNCAFHGTTCTPRATFTKILDRSKSKKGGGGALLRCWASFRGETNLEHLRKCSPSCCQQDLAPPTCSLLPGP